MERLIALVALKIYYVREVIAALIIFVVLFAVVAIVVFVLRRTAGTPRA